jgi:hypothetical protein
MFHHFFINKANSYLLKILTLLIIANAAEPTLVLIIASLKMRFCKTTYKKAAINKWLRLKI